jgi:hypothetical protein
MSIFLTYCNALLYFWLLFAVLEMVKNRGESFAHSLIPFFAHGEAGVWAFIRRLSRETLDRFASGNDKY